jgi:hypothetical protein
MYIFTWKTVKSVCKTESNSDIIAKNTGLMELFKTTPRTISLWWISNDKDDIEENSVMFSLVHCDVERPSFPEHVFGVLNIVSIITA